MDNNIDRQLRGTLEGRAEEFTIDGYDGIMRIHHPSYGVSVLAMETLEDAGLDSRALALDPCQELLRLASVNKSAVCRAIALYTTATKEEALGDFARERATLLEELMTVDEAARVAVVCLSMDDVEKFMRHYGLSRESDRYARAAKVKMQKSESVSFGGLTVYGSLFDPIMERYGWTLDYVIWGISYANLRMIAADMPRTLCMTREERRKAGITNEKVIRAETIKDINKLREMFPD